MDGTIGEIRGFAGTFCPAYWMYCWGQELSIQQYTPLYAVIGTTYGGNGYQTFKLPDFRGRIPVGQGIGPGLSVNWNPGMTYGSETNVLQAGNLTSHSHTATTGTMSVTGTASGTISPACYGDTGGANTPAANVPGNASGRYANAADADAVMAPVSASLALNGTVAGNVTSGFTGNSQPVNNIQPSLAIPWLICIYGNFPTRD